jgi:hypothetical protein
MPKYFVDYVEHGAYHSRLLPGNKPWYGMSNKERSFLRGINAVAPFGPARIINRYNSYRMLVEMLSWPQ